MPDRHSRAAADPYRFYTTANANRLTQEMQSNTRENIRECAEEIPDAADALCGLWGVIAPAVIQEAFSLIAEQIPGVTETNSPHFNWLDTVALTAQGVSQLRDRETHRPATTKLKGFINIASGLSLGIVTGLALSAVGTVTLATAAYTLAATMGATTLLSCDETFRAARRGLSPEYWLVDNLKQLEKLHSVSIVKQMEKLERRQAQFENLRAAHGYAEPLTRKEKALQWTVLRAQNKLETLQQKERHLLRVTQNRITTNKKCHAYYEKHYSESLFAPLHRTGTPPDLELDTGKRANTFEKAIHTKNAKEFSRALMGTFYVGLLFTGTLLLCFPGAQLPGAICLGIFAAAFLAKNRQLPIAMTKGAMDGAKAAFNHIKSALQSRGPQDRLAF